MKKNIKIFLGFIFFISSIKCNKYVTYDSHIHSLLGDKLLEYSIAKWISWKYKVPLLYQPFTHSNSFVFHDKEYFNESLLTLYNKIRLKYFSYDSFNREALYTVRLNHSHDINWNDYNNLIDEFTIIQHSLPDNPSAILYEGVEKGGYFDYLFTASRKNKSFLTELRSLIYPKQKIPILNLPKNKISVAIHVRCGGKFDKFPKHIGGTSLKVAPFHYYVDQLKRLSIILNNAPLFVYIFTDHSNPLVLIEKFKKNLIKFNNIIFESRNKNNKDATIIEDLFLMSKFDCLIRPRSSFSMAAQLIGNHKIVISPKQGFWKNKQFYVNKIGIMMIDQNLNFITPRMPSDIQPFIQKLISKTK